MADITPVTREEFYLAKAGGQDVPVPSAVTREEYYLEKLSNDSVVVPLPVTRREKFLYFACGGEIDLPSEDRMTRLERLIAKAGGMDVATPTAVTRLEKFWANVEGGGWKVTELTGTLPITFKANGSALVNYRVYGTANGVGERTKNFVRVIVGATSQGITFTVDPVAGTVTANGTATGTAQLRITINNPDDPNNTNVPSGNYYYSGCPSGGSNSKYNCYSWDNDTGARSKKWDGTTNAEQDNGQGSCQVQINGNRQSIILRLASGYTANNVVFKPMLRRADTTPDFEPYGYKLPLTIANGTESKSPDVFIGDSKLGVSDFVDYETQSITRNGISEPAPLPLPELETFKDTNTLDSTVEVGEVTIKGKIKEA